MIKVYTLFLLAGSCLVASAQTFSNNSGGDIDEVGIYDYFPMEVSGLPAAMDSTDFGLLQACWTIQHTYDADLDIVLQSPAGVQVVLSNNNGAEYNHYTGTCVQEDATDGEISAADAPFTGNFFPDNSLNHLNDGSDPNGTWYLIVIDESPTETGTMIECSITFGADPPPTHEGGPCTTVNAAGCECADGSLDCDLLPNMINSVKYIQNNWTEYKNKIRMGVATPNIGYGPLEMHSTGDCFCDSLPALCDQPCPDGNYPKEDVIQRIYHKSEAIMSTYDVSAGTMTYHPTHGHIHVDNWTHNTLRIRGDNADARTWPIIAESDKQSFCLINLGNCTEANEYCIDATGEVIDKKQIPNGGLGAVSGCFYDQGIYVGKYDAYDQYLDGQEIKFTNLCNGNYYLVSITDPNNSVKEMDEDDNYVAVLLTFEKQDANCCQGNFGADSLIGSAPFEVHFVDSTIPVAVSWVWDFGDGTTSTDQFPNHVYAYPGTYTVSLITTTSTGCTDTTVRTDYVTVGIPSSAAEVPQNSLIQMAVFPNPLTPSSMLSIQLDQAEPADLYIGDLMGRECYSLFTGYHPSGQEEYEIGTAYASLLPGIYFLHAIIGGKDHVLKLAKL